MMNGLKKLWKTLGSGLVAGGSDNDASAILTYSISGARFGFSQLWSVVFILPVMVAVQEMSARIGALSGCGLAGNMKRHYPLWLLAFVAVIIVGVNIFNLGANIYGMAGALNLLLPIRVEILAVIVSVMVLLMTVLLKYHHLVRVFKWVALSLGVYMLAFFAVDAPWRDILRHAFIPSVSLNKEFLLVLFAVVGTTLSPYLYFWQASEEADEIRQGNPRIQVCRFRTVPPKKLGAIEFDTAFGMIFSNVISFFVIALTGATLFSAGGSGIETLRAAADALRPFLGDYAYLLFTAGIVGSGILAIPVLAGSAAYVLAEVFNWRGSLDHQFGEAREFYVVLILATAAGLTIPFLGIDPVRALFYTAVLNGFVAPLLILFIINMANNPKIVGSLVSRPIVNALAYLGFFIMTAGALFVLIA
ncbi:MAG: divalent metal cation transporter [Patescibacteria group bacterium]